MALRYRHPLGLQETHTLASVGCSAGLDIANNVHQMPGDLQEHLAQCSKDPETHSRLDRRENGDARVRSIDNSLRPCEDLTRHSRVVNQ